MQSLTNRTTGVSSRSLTGNYQTVRHSWEAKTDGTYFLTAPLGGDHSLKFGLGWRRNPIQTFSHYSGGARASVQCVGNDGNNCGDGSYVPAGSATGIVPFQADPLSRPAAQQRLVDLQRLHPGQLQPRQDAPQRRPPLRLAAVEVPGRLRPGQRAGADSCCRRSAKSATQTDAITGKKIQSFSNWSPRLSATYDLFGNGKTSIHASGSYFYNTKITLANALGGLFTQTAPALGTEPVERRLQHRPRRAAGPTRTATASSRSTS